MKTLVQINLRGQIQGVLLILNPEVSLWRERGRGGGRGGGRGAETIAYFTIIGMCVNQGMVLRVLDHRRGTQFYDFAVIKGCPSEMVTLNRA